MSTFIKENHDELVACINKAMGEEETKRQSIEEIKLWIENDEGLYNWAKAEGVRV